VALALILARLLCSEAFDFTQQHLLHWSWHSLCAGSYPDAHLLRDISTLPTTVANTLFLCKRSARPDLQHAVPFLCTRVQSSDEDDWKRRLGLFKCLEQTVEDELALGVDEGDVLLTR